jgi:hypothetical protein
MFQLLFAVLILAVGLILFLKLKKKKMEVICDTHIWYDIGNAKISPVPENVKLIATFNSIDEFSRTKNLVRYPDYTKNGVQAMFKYSRVHAIYEPPLVHLKKISDPLYQYDIVSNLNPILKFTSKVAKGFAIDVSKTEEYSQFCQDRKNDLESVSEIFNKEAARIKGQIKDLKIHRKEDSIPLNRHLISLFVAKATKTDGLPTEFDWQLIELFENVLKHYFNALETGEYKSKANDWYDLFLLLYVQPGKKLWTKEKRWIALIERSGMEDYLFRM